MGVRVHLYAPFSDALYAFESRGFGWEIGLRLQLAPQDSFRARCVVRQVDKALIESVRYGTEPQHLTGNVTVILKNPQRGRQITIYLPQIVRD